MRFGPDDKFWVVTDPTPESCMEDIVFQASLRQIELQFKGGLTMDRNPRLFTDKNEADIEGYGRLVAARAARVIAERGLKPGEEPVKIELVGPDGEILFQADMGKGLTG
jgi:hypothetical protein